MIDQWGREITYGRISVTEACNLRCLYCKPTFVADNPNIMTPAEIGRLVQGLASLDINKIRITGGEPLCRKDLPEIFYQISRIPTIKDVPMTTNGVGLWQRLDELKSAGLKRVNISLDTLDRERFIEITGVDKLEDVLKSIEACIDKHIKVKINTVLLKEVNLNEVDKLIAKAVAYGIHWRFIEMMPIGHDGESAGQGISNTDIIESRHDLIPIDEILPGAVSQDFRVEGSDKAVIGFISPMSHGFCHMCNKIRITSDGKIKPCLGQNMELDLLPALRNNGDVVAIIKQAIEQKPFRHGFGQGYSSSRTMNRIGG